jgi:hypothetical protein
MGQLEVSGAPRNSHWPAVRWNHSSHGAASQVEAFAYSPATPYFSIMVDTVDTTRMAFMVDAVLTGGRSALVMGETGVGKSMLLRAHLQK